MFCFIVCMRSYSNKSFIIIKFKFVGFHELIATLSNLKNLLAFRIIKLDSTKSVVLTASYWAPPEEYLFHLIRIKWFLNHCFIFMTHKVSKFSWLKMKNKLMIISPFRTTRNWFNWICIRRIIRPLVILCRNRSRNTAILWFPYRLAHLIFVFELRRL